MRGAIAVLVLFAAPAAAAAGPSTIVLDAPAGCPDRVAFLELVAQHAEGAPAEVDAEVHVERAGARWIATVDLPGAPTRRFAGTACAEVLDAAALVIALAIDVAEPEPEPEQPEPEPEAAPEPPSAPAEVARVSRPAPRAARRTALRVRAGGVADTGSLPGPAIAASLSASAWRARSGFELSLALFRPSAASVGDGGQVAPVGLWTVGLRGCRRVWRADACLGGEAGRMTADAAHLDGGTRAGGTWAAVSGSGWMRRRVGAAAAYAGFELLAGVIRPRFVLDDDTGLHRPSPVAGRLIIGLELDLR